MLLPYQSTYALFYNNTGGVRYGIAGIYRHPQGPSGPPASGKRQSKDVEANRVSIPLRSGDGIGAEDSSGFACSWWQWRCKEQWWKAEGFGTWKRGASQVTFKRWKEEYLTHRVKRRA